MATAVCIWAIVFLFFLSMTVGSLAFIILCLVMFPLAILLRAASISPWVLHQTLVLEGLYQFDRARSLKRLVLSARIASWILVGGFVGSVLSSFADSRSLAASMLIITALSSLTLFALGWIAGIRLWRLPSAVRQALACP